MRILVSKPREGRVTITLLGGPNGRQVKEQAERVPLKDVKERTEAMLNRHYPPA